MKPRRPSGRILHPSANILGALDTFLVYSFMCCSFFIIEFTTIAGPLVPQITIYLYGDSQLQLRS